MPDMRYWAYCHTHVTGTGLGLMVTRCIVRYRSVLYDQLVPLLGCPITESEVWTLQGTSSSFTCARGRGGLRSAARLVCDDLNRLSIDPLEIYAGGRLPCARYPSSPVETGRYQADASCCLASLPTPTSTTSTNDPDYVQLSSQDVLLPTFKTKFPMCMHTATNIREETVQLLH